jgi:hypothetical protein
MDRSKPETALPERVVGVGFVRNGSENVSEMDRGDVASSFTVADFAIFAASRRDFEFSRENQKRMFPEITMSLRHFPIIDPRHCDSARYRALTKALLLHPKKRPLDIRYSLRQKNNPSHSVGRAKSGL